MITGIPTNKLKEKARYLVVTNEIHITFIMNVFIIVDTFNHGKQFVISIENVNGFTVNKDKFMISSVALNYLIYGIEELIQEKNTGEMM